MICVKLKGGLGNQMFQYAAGKFLSLKNRTALVLDTSYFNNDFQGKVTPRNYGLGHFNISESSGSGKSLRSYLLELFEKKCVFKESKISAYKPQLTESRSKKIELEGYWQSEKYFSPIREILCKEFTPVKPGSAACLHFFDEIRSSQAVSIHVRRGDYVNDEKVKATHYVCTPDYFEKAIHYINSRITDPTFFVFSDDVAWCKANLPSALPACYVTGTLAHEDIYLMSNCMHHVISNSSFSWWGAWLNQFKDKIVVAPQNWKVNPEGTQDVVPERWIKI
jgi:hypothetical protein